MKFKMEKGGGREKRNNVHKLIIFCFPLQMPAGQHQYGGQYPPGMPNQRHPMPMGGGTCPGPGPMKPSMSSMYHRRPTPYHNPYMQKRQPMYPNGTQMDVSMTSWFYVVLFAIFAI